MASPFRDLTNKRFGELLVLERGPNYNGRCQWLCLCSCGARKVIRTSSLVGGLTISCGHIGKRLAKTGGKQIYGEQGREAQAAPRADT